MRALKRGGYDVFLVVDIHGRCGHHTDSETHFDYTKLVPRSRFIERYACFEKRAHALDVALQSMGTHSLRMSQHLERLQYVCKLHVFVYEMGCGASSSFGYRTRYPPI